MIQSNNNYEKSTYFQIADVGEEVDYYYFQNFLEYSLQKIVCVEP